MSMCVCMYECISLRIGERSIPSLTTIPACLYCLELFHMCWVFTIYYASYGILQALAHTLSTPCMPWPAGGDVGGLRSWFIMSSFMGCSPCVHIIKGHGWLHKEVIKCFHGWNCFKDSQKVWQCKQQIRCVGQETEESKVPTFKPM